MIPTWKLTAVQVLGLSCLGVLLGIWLKRRVPILDRLNIPVPIAGGMVFAVIATGPTRQRDQFRSGRGAARSPDGRLHDDGGHGRAAAINP